MSLLAAASCPLVEHYQLTSKPGATRFRAAVQLTRWEPNLELRARWAPSTRSARRMPTARTRAATSPRRSRCSTGGTACSSRWCGRPSARSKASPTHRTRSSSNTRACCCCGRKKGGGQYARAGIDEHDDDGYDDVLDGYPYDDYDDEMEAAADDGGAFRPPRLPPALVVDHTRARDGGREKAGLVYV